jgi:hypothetical protein
LQAPAGCLATPWQPLVLVDPAAYGWTGSEAEFRDRIVSELRRRELPVDTWQRHTLPEQAVFRRDQARAWHPGFVQTELAAPDGPYPVASRLVRRGFCVGMHPYPLHVQSSKVMRHYAEGFHAVFADMENVLHGTYTPRRPTPPIPAGDLWTSTSGAEASV